MPVFVSQISLLGTPILSGDLWAEVKADESEWTLEEPIPLDEDDTAPKDNNERELRLLLFKTNKTFDVTMWPCVLKGHPEVETGALKSEAARAKAAELDSNSEDVVSALLQQMSEAGESLPTNDY